MALFVKYECIRHGAQFILRIERKTFASFWAKYGADIKNEIFVLSCLSQMRVSFQL
jgi:hypothetical protein